MPYVKNDFLNKEIIGTHTNWDDEAARVGDDILTLTQDTDVIKRGDGINVFLNLEEIVDITDMADVEIISNRIDTNLGSDRFKKISFFNNDLRVKRTEVNEVDLNFLFEYENFEESNSVMIPIINGPIQKRYGTSFTLRANSFSSYREKGCKIESYQWILHDSSVVVGEEIIIDIPDNSNLVGAVWTYSCYAIDTLGNKSESRSFSITIADEDYPVIDIVAWETVYFYPNIIDVTWDIDIHEVAQTYTLTVNAVDPKNKALAYEVVCDISTVIVTQDEIDEEKFTVTYPMSEVDFPVRYWISIINEDMLDNVIMLTKTVNNIEIPPVIDSFSWDDNTHEEAGSYVLTITAHDPQSRDITYDVTCDDVNTTITQTANLNIFDVVYPLFPSDTNVIFDIVVTNIDGLTDIEIDTKLVANIEMSPTIDSFSWNDDAHEENTLYVLTINATDPQSQDLIYEVVCDDVNTTITQTGTPNIFDVVYPLYSTTTDVEFTMTITNEDTLTDIETDTKTVINVEDLPIIDSFSWDIDIHDELESYVLTITAHDPQSQTLTYEVVCDEPTVSITQTGSDHIWDITYPNYEEDTTIEYTITITNEDNLTDIETDTKIVNDIKIPPTINSFVWDNDDHEENSTYTLTIDASDPQSQNLIYGVICNDLEITIVQTGIPNIFDITYPEYAEDTTIEFLISVTNEDNLTDSEFDTKIVEDIT